MPDLDTTLHLDMLAAGRRRRGLVSRLHRAWRALAGHDDLYGLEWGDPDTNPPLRYVRERFLEPFIHPGATVVEIGPGGGRWTRYLLRARQVYAVDYHPELLAELRRNFARPNLRLVRNHGDDFPGVPEGSVDFVFSFGLFVHLETDVIARYLGNIRPILKPNAQVVLQYSDQTKPMARRIPGFSDNTPQRMLALIEDLGYVIEEEDSKTLWHSAVVRFRLGPTAGPG
jgi:SAM-dependent methyltransferase